MQWPISRSPPLQPTLIISAKISASDITLENAQAQLKDLFDKLQIQTNNTTGEAHHHFKTLALRHIFSNQPIIRTLTFVAGSDEDRKECANNLTDSFLDMYSSVLWDPRDVLKDRSSPVMDYFELLLQMEAEDEVLAKVLGEWR